MKLYLNILAGMTLCFGAAVFPAHAQTDSVQTTDQIDARHDAAEKQCDALSGDQKDICLERAEADKDVAEAQTESAKKKAEADHDAAKVRQDADYDVAMKKCDALSGDAQDKCEADAKTRYGK